MNMVQNDMKNVKNCVIIVFKIVKKSCFFCWFSISFITYILKKFRRYSRLFYITISANIILNKFSSIFAIFWIIHNFYKTHLI